MRVFLMLEETSEGRVSHEEHCTSRYDLSTRRNLPRFLPPPLTSHTPVQSKGTHTRTRVVKRKRETTKMVSSTRVALFGACVAMCAACAQAATDGGESDCLPIQSPHVLRRATLLPPRRSSRLACVSSRCVRRGGASVAFEIWNFSRAPHTKHC